MKKSAKTGRAIRPQRSPVLPIRVPKPDYDKLKSAAKDSGMTLSEYVWRLIARGQEWQESIAAARNLLRQANAEAKRIVKSTLVAELRRHNWKRDAVRGTWAPPEVHGFPPDGFRDEPAESPALDPRITTEIKRAVQTALDEREGVL